NIPDIRFDEVLADIQENLTKKTARLTLSLAEVANNKVVLAVEVENLTGHKLPSGYPSRRAILRLVVKNAATGEVLFSSGITGSDGHIQGATAPWQPHYDTIYQPSQAQVFEMIMADVNGNRTTVLERAAFALKDNRLPPKGFVHNHPVYDTVAVVGVPPSDLTFNRKNNQEGSGTDVVHYVVPVGPEVLSISAWAWLDYQPVPPDWMDEMFVWDAPEINHWKSIYQTADKTPITVASDSLLNVKLGWSSAASTQPEFTLFPNPVAQGFITVPDGFQLRGAAIYDVRGRLLVAYSPTELAGQSRLRVPASPGTYFLRIEHAQGSFVRKFVVP
ncbi:MAG: T9SS type A sorting domain-containing protein, partial [Chitinophagales bacterium]|nr:T9SS type A sorting domain-containing protein [Chitinophagales bacterium]